MVKERRGRDMWAETFKYLSVIHYVNHHHYSRQRDRRGREKARERRERAKGKKGCENKEGEQMTECE